jgi:iron complex outermembrane receptor protein
VQWLFYGSLPSVVITESVDDSDVSGDISAVYAVNDNFNIYGRLGTGYRAPSIQGRTLWCPDIDGTDPETNCVTIGDTEKIISFEAGIKTILSQNRVRFNLTGYVFEMSDQQVTAVGGAANVATLINIDKTKGYGLEADMQWTPTAHWLMTFGASWNPTEIVDPGLTVAGCGGGCTTLDPTQPAPPPVNFVAFVDGNPLPHAPDVVFNGIINFRSDAVDKGFFGTLDWAYYSEKNFFMYESAEFKDDSLEFGLRLGYGWNQGNYEVALFGRNITDAEIARGGIDFNNLTGFTNDPRILGVEFFARF